MKKQAFIPDILQLKTNARPTSELPPLRKLFNTGAAQPANIDFLLFCTQSPDYFLPSTACLVQTALGLPTHAGALDFDLGCSGFVYGLGLAKGLIETGQARNILLITAETYSKFMNRLDKSARTIFGDAAAATLISAIDSRKEPAIGPFVYGTDGTGADNLIVRVGGMRYCRSDAVETTDESGNRRSPGDLYMNGPDVFSFTMREVPGCLKSLLEQANLRMDEVDLFVFHQANRYMLEHLRKSLRIPEDRFFISMQHCGNTVSSTIPIALRDAQEAGALKSGHCVAVVGFGVGYSWGATIIRWL